MRRGITKVQWLAFSTFFLLFLGLLQNLPHAPTVQPGNQSRTIRTEIKDWKVHSTCQNVKDWTDIMNATKCAGYTMKFFFGIFFPPITLDLVWLWVIYGVIIAVNIYITISIISGLIPG